ncbi:MAG: hypothetical protein K9K82_08410 [Desulfobacteraceae bacterium]|nr:hypothetical protein [Desulfobacteraceae bacterium]
MSTWETCDIGKKCDKIIVLQNGQITEQGPHKTLLSQNNAYAQWFEKQSLVNN